MSKKKSSRYVDPGAPLDNNNLPIDISSQIDTSVLPKIPAPQASSLGDTGSATYVGDTYEPTRYDDNNTYQDDLRNLDNIRSGNQGILSSLGNSAAKFVGKTALNTVGGILGTAYGAGDAIIQGDISKLWDNSFLDKVDAVDKGLGDIFKVYKSSDYEDQNFLQRMFLHPLQFTDDTTEALSFTAGAILTELATSGFGSESILPKALKYMKFLDRGAEAAEATGELTSVGGKILRGIDQAGTLTKKLATGASYESIIESRQATMQLREKMYGDWAKEHPNEEMPDDIKNDIDSRLSKAGLFTYLSNLALVGSSNIMQFPKLFGLGYRSSQAAEGSIVRNLETGLFESTLNNPSKVNRVLGALKTPAEEGLYEEGLQNVVSGTAKQYWDRKNDPESKDGANSFASVFAHNLADTYTSKAGWNDIGMGLIIGGLGAPGRGALSILGENNSLGRHGFTETRDAQGNITGSQRQNIWEGGLLGSNVENEHERHEVQSIVDDLNRNTNLFKSMKSNYGTIVTDRSLEADKENALQAGDIFEFNNARDDQIHNYVSSRIKAGLSEDLDDTVSSMKSMSSDEFYTEFRGEEASNKLTDREKVKFQQESIKEFEDKVANTKEATRIADDVYKGDNPDLREELIHSIAAAKNLDTREKSMNQALSDLSNGFISNQNIRLADDPQVESDLISNFVLNNPTDAALNGDKIRQLLDDSRKLRDKRMSYLNLYNNLFTKKGQQDFEAYQAKLQEDDDKAKATEAATQEAQAREVEKQENNKATVEKADKIKDQPIPVDNTTEGENGIPTDEIPNVNFGEDTSTEETPTSQPVDTNTPNTSTVTPTNIGLDTEEETIVDVEDHKNKPTDNSNNGEVKNAPDEDHDVDNYEEINGDRQRTSGNVIAYLGVNKTSRSELNGDEILTRSFNIFDNNGNVQVNEFVDTKLFSKNFYKPGEAIGISIPTYSQMQERGLQNYTESDYTKNSNDIGEFPIAITSKDGKIIGYLPTQSGIKRLVAEEFRDAALKQNLDLRTTIFNNPKGTTYTTTITSKSPGFLITDSVENQRPLFTALGDGSKLANNVRLGIAKQGDIALNSGRSKFTDGDIINKDSIKDGVVYSIVPSSAEGKYIAYPMKTNKIGRDNAETIVEALKIFAKKNHNEQEQQSVKNITEFNFSNFNDVNAFVNKIMYANSSNTATESTIFKLFKDNLILSKFDESMKFKLSDIVNKQSTRDELIDILSDRYYSVSLSNLNNRNDYYSYSYNTNTGIIEENQHKNYQDYLNSDNVVTSNIKGIKIQGNEYAFTAQPVIGLSDQIVQSSTPESTTSTPERAEAVPQVDNPSTYEDLKVGDRVRQGNKEGKITGKQDGKVAIQFDGGGKLTVSPNFSEIYKTNTMEPERAEAVTPVTERKTTKKLFDPSKVKPKSFDDINPEFLNKQSVQSGEDLMRKCL